MHRPGRPLRDQTRRHPRRADEGVRQRAAVAPRDLGAERRRSPDNDYLVYERRADHLRRRAPRRALRSRRWLREQGVEQGDRVAIATRNLARVGRSRSGRRRRSARSSYRSTRGGPDPSSRTASPTRAAVVLFADDERAERIAPHLGDTGRAGDGARSVPTRDARRRRAVVRRSSAATTRRCPRVAIDPDADADDHVHVGHDRPSEGRGADAAQLRQLPDAGRVPDDGSGRAQAAAVTGQPPAPLPLATLLTFPLFHVGGLQSFLLPYTAAGGKIVLMYKWDAGAGGRARSNASRSPRSPGCRRRCSSCSKSAAQKGIELESLTGISSGATLVPPELVRRIDEQTSVARRARQRLRPDGDVGRGDRQLRPGVRRQSRERRQADLAGHRGAHRRRRTAAECRRATSARSG